MKHTTFLLLAILFFTSSIILHGQTDFSRTYTDTLPESFILNTAELREHIFKETPSKLRARLDSRATYKFADMSSIQESYRFSSGQIYSDWPSLEDYLNRVLQRVLPTELKDTKYIHAYIVKDGAFNAYMTPSGMMFINIGLIAQIEDEATLAAILAHELGHFFERHSLREYVKLEVGAFDISNNRNRRAARTKFSVKNELESDRLALEWTQRAGYSLSGVRKFGEMSKRMDTNYLLRRKNLWKTIETTHPKPEKRIGLYYDYRKENPADSGALFLVDEEEFHLFTKQARSESLKHLLHNFQYHSCIELGFKFHLFEPENHTYIYYLMEGIRRLCYLNTNKWRENFITGRYFTETIVKNDTVKIKMKDHLFDRMRTDILNLNSTQLKQIKARFYWDGTKRFTTYEEAFTFFNKVAEVLGSSECILSNALSFSFDKEKMKPLLKKYLAVENINHREYATSLLNGTIFSDLENNKLTLLSEFTVIIKQGNDEILVRDESKGNEDHLASILAPVRPQFPERTMMALNSLQKHQLNDYITLNQLQDFSFTRLFARGERTQLHIMEPRYWELMKKLKVNDIEFVICQYYDARKYDNTIEGYQKVLNYTNKELFNETKRHRYVDSGISSVRCIKDGVMKLKISVGERKLDFNKPGFDQIISLIDSNLKLADKEAEIADKKYKRSLD